MKLFARLLIAASVLLVASVILASFPSLLLGAKALAAAHPAQTAIIGYAVLLICAGSLLHFLVPQATPRGPNRFDNILVQEPPFASIRNSMNQHRRRYPAANFVPPPTFTPSANARRFAPQSTETLPPTSTFQSRLDAIGHKGDIHEDFHDPITLNVMEDPVNAITEIEKFDGTIQEVNYILDKSTYDTLKTLPCGRRMQPANRQPILRCEPCDDLKATIEQVITELESEYHLNQLNQERTAVRA